MDDIHFDPGSNYVLVIDTRSYSGNFTREMTATIFGIHDEQCENEYVRDALKKFDGDTRAADLGENVLATQIHDEYGEITSTIWTTPGRVNDGQGGHFDEASYTGTGWPAYESVGIFISRPLSKEDLEFVGARAEKFCKEHTGFDGKPCPITFAGIRQVEVRVERRVVTLEELKALG